MNWLVAFTLDILLLSLILISLPVEGKRRNNNDGRRRRQTHTVDHNVTFEFDPLTNSVDPDFIWATTTVAVGDTAVLHCSFDAIFSQLRNGNIDWVRESSSKGKNRGEKIELIATGKKVVIPEKRYRVFRPHNSALSVLIIRRSKKRDAGVYRCNLSGSSTRHKYMILNVTESKIEAHTSPAKIKARMNKDVTLWCNATGYPKPMVYWTREDRNRRLPDGTYQFWGNGLKIEKASEADTGIYACYLDNFVQPVVSYKFSLIVEDRPWNVDAFKMRFDSSQWYDYRNEQPHPVVGKTYLLMCETKGAPKPLPEIRWFFNSKEITNSRYYYIIEDKPEWRNSYASSTLVIKRYETTMEGEYTCVASNVFRMKKKSIAIKGEIDKDNNEDKEKEQKVENPQPANQSPRNKHGPSQSVSWLSNTSVDRTPNEPKTQVGDKKGIFETSDDEDLSEESGSGTD